MLTLEGLEKIAASLGKPVLAKIEANPSTMPAVQSLLERAGVKYSGDPQFLAPLLVTKEWMPPNWFIFRDTNGDAMGIYLLKDGKVHELDMVGSKKFITRPMNISNRI